MEKMRDEEKMKQRRTEKKRSNGETRQVESKGVNWKKQGEDGEDKEIRGKAAKRLFEANIATQNWIESACTRILIRHLRLSCMYVMGLSSRMGRRKRGRIRGRSRQILLSTCINALMYVH